MARQICHVFNADRETEAIRFGLITKTTAAIAIATSGRCLILDMTLLAHWYPNSAMSSDCLMPCVCRVSICLCARILSNKASRRCAS